MEKCNEKLVVLESFDQNTSALSSASKASSMSTTTAATSTGGAVHDENLIYQQFHDLNIDENIILCWENYSIPLQELVKALSSYEKNMIEYYRFEFFI